MELDPGASESESAFKFPGSRSGRPACDSRWPVLEARRQRYGPRDCQAVGDRPDGLRGLVRAVAVTERARAGRPVTAAAGGEAGQG
jgi:hypothetical protein